MGLDDESLAGVPLPSVETASDAVFTPDSLSASLPHPSLSCPECQSSEVRRSHPRGPEKLARHLFARKMYRCLGCNRRFGVIAFNLHEDATVVAVWTGIVLLLISLFLLLTGRLVLAL